MQSWVQQRAIKIIKGLDYLFFEAPEKSGTVQPGEEDAQDSPYQSV